MQGHIVKSINNNIDTKTKKVNIEFLQNGFYLLTIYTDNSQYSKKIIIKR